MADIAILWAVVWKAMALYSKDTMFHHLASVWSQGGVKGPFASITAVRWLQRPWGKDNLRLPGREASEPLKPYLQSFHEACFSSVEPGRWSAAISKQKRSLRSSCWHLCCFFDFIHPHFSDRSLRSTRWSIFTVWTARCVQEQDLLVCRGRPVINAQHISSSTL